LKKTNHNLLLIHNKGSLALSAIKKLSKHFSIDKFLVEKNNSIINTKRNLQKIINNQNIDLVVYISGETKDKKFMMKLNYELPYQIANICDKESIPIVYFSSLSVFGIPNEKNIKQITKKIPIDLYGKSKYKFDSNLKKDFPSLRFCSIAPGSIINPNSRNINLLQKALNIISKKPLIWLLMFISPAGNYACVHIDDLIKILVIECLNIISAKEENKYQIFKNCSTKVKIYDLVSFKTGVKPFFKLRPIPIKIINSFSIFLSNNLKIKLLTYFADIDYVNEYNFLEKRDISEFFQNQL